VIPPLTARGLLPAGVHVADLADIGGRFGSSNQRRASLFGKLSEFVDLVQALCLFEALFVDGSFVTDKPQPGDIDSVLWFPYPARVLGHPDVLALTDLESIKRRFEIHLFLEPSGTAPADSMTDFFQHLRTADALERRVPPHRSNARVS
jgi:hypothetical protein